MKEKLKIELEEIEERLKGDFVSPKDIRRKDEIISLLLTNGESSSITIKVTKGRNPQRVTSFTKDRR